MELRKIQIVGNRSYAVSLPKGWILKNHLKNHDRISILETDNNELLLTSSRQQKSQASSIRINADDVNTLPELLVFCYMKNIDEIICHATKISYDALRSIRKTLNYLEGYEITSQTEKEIIIQFVFKEVSITIPTIIRRMYYMLGVQVQSIENRDHATLTDTESALDRLYYLSTRIVFALIKDYSLRKQNEIEHEEDTYFINNITKRLENIGDYLLRLNSEQVKPKDLAITKELLDILGDVLAQKANLHLLKVKLAQPITTKNERVHHILQRIQELCKDILDAKLSIQFNKYVYT